MTASVAPDKRSSLPMPWLLFNGGNRDSSGHHCFNFNGFPASSMLPPQPQCQSPNAKCQASIVSRTSAQQEPLNCFREKVSRERYLDVNDNCLLDGKRTAVVEGAKLSNAGCSETAQSSSKRAEAKEHCNAASSSNIREPAHSSSELIASESDNVPARKSSINKEDQNFSTRELSYRSDPCSGLTDYIKKKKKAFTCARCGCTFTRNTKPTNAGNNNSSNQKFKSGDSSFKEAFRWTRYHSVDAYLCSKHTLICPTCGKRHRSAALQKRLKNKSLSNGFHRSMTWPIPLEKIAEDATEGSCQHVYDAQEADPAKYVAEQDLSAAPRLAR